MIQFGDFCYDPESRILYRGDEEILLPPRVLAVLESLLKRPGEIVPKEDLLASAWEGAFVGEDSLTQAISQLRQVLDDDPQRPDYIQTVPRRGYRLIAEVSRPLGGEPAAAPGPGERPDASSDTHAPTSPNAPAGTVGPLQRESRLGRYQVLERAGAGAMGEVWRARDDELDREVAVKLVPPDLASDPRAMERFRREARLLAAVDHANVAAIHTVEEVDGTRFIVMELVEGQTLGDRLREGRLEIGEALELGLQIACGLEVAHERGIVHRDLKPDNVAVTDDGRVKLLDFGLAKRVQREELDGPRDPVSLTQTGTLLGTAPYMSPEQVRGDDVDQRTDIWAFGCLLYEMLTGQRAFFARNRSDTLAAILTREPEWQPLPAGTPPALRVLLRRCLQKEPSRRLHHIADARIELEDALREPDALVSAVADGLDGVAGPGPPRRSAWSSPTPLHLALAVAVIVAAWGWLQPRAMPPSRSAAFVERLAPGWRLTGGSELEEANWALQRPTRTAMALSPDDSHLVYAATDGEVSRLFLRPLGRLEATPITGTEGGASPFFSPDGRSIGFFAEGSLKRVPVGEGEVRTILEDAPAPFGAHWGEDDTIVLADGQRGGILSVPATGGERSPLTTVATDDGEQSHRLPQLLPGARGLVFTVQRGRNFDIAVQAMGSGDHEILVENGADARFLPSGHLLFARAGTLMAVPFDEERLRLDGRPVPVVEDLMQALFVDNSELLTGAAQFNVSASGSLVYASGDVHPELDFPLAWVDRDGNLVRVPTPPGNHLYPRLSPDGNRIAYVRGRPANRDLWIYDLRTETPLRLTRGLDLDSPVWSPEGGRVVFGARGGDSAINLYSMELAGGDEPERLTTSSLDQYPGSWSSDGVIAFVQSDGPVLDVWVLILDGDGGTPRSEPFLAGPDRELYPAFSPTGEWLAYSSDDTGEPEVYVTPYPGPGERVQISKDGGMSPVWAREGRQILYRQYVAGARGQRLMAVDITLGDTVTAGPPRFLFEVSLAAATEVSNYDVASDGRLLINVNPTHDPRPVTSLHLVLDWFAELERLVRGAG